MTSDHNQVTCRRERPNPATSDAKFRSPAMPDELTARRAARNAAGAGGSAPTKPSNAPDARQTLDSVLDTRLNAHLARLGQLHAARRALPEALRAAFTTAELHDIRTMAVAAGQPDRCHCAWLGIGTPEHEPGFLCPRDNDVVPQIHEDRYQQAIATLLDVAQRTGSPAAQWAAEYLTAAPDHRAASVPRTARGKLARADPSLSAAGPRSPRPAVAEEADRG